MLKHGARGPHRSRAGFTLMEVVVSTAIVVMLAAATAPSLMGFIDRQRAQATANILQTLQMGIVNGTTAGFYNLIDSTGATKMLPGMLHDLANPLVAAVATEHNSCGTNGAGHTHRYSTTAVTAWNNNGPFVTFPITIGTSQSNAVSTPLGFIQDSIERDTIAPVATGLREIALRIIKVRLDDVTALDQIMDGGDGSAAGSIQWTADAVAGFEDVKFFIPVSWVNC